MSALDFSQCFFSPLKGSSTSQDSDEKGPPKNQDSVFETPIPKRHKKKKKKSIKKEEGINATLSDESSSSVNKSLKDLVKNINGNLSNTDSSQSNLSLTISPSKKHLLSKRMTFATNLTSTPLPGETSKSFTKRSPKKKEMKHALPKGYKSIEIEGDTNNICAENIADKDIELWLISAPSDFDIQNLDNVKFSLANDKQIISNKKEDSKTFFEIETKATKQLSTFCPILPSLDHQNFAATKGFKGEIQIKQAVDVPSPKKPPPIVRNNVELPRGLQFRLRAFGNGPNGDDESKSRKRKLESVPEETIHEHSSKPKKKKKKKKAHAN